MAVCFLFRARQSLHRELSSHYRDLLKLAWGRTKNDANPKNYVYAYVIVEVNERALRQNVLSELNELDGVIYTASLTNGNKLIAKVRARNKSVFDDLMMDQIQVIKGVEATHSFIIINERHLLREPQSRESTVKPKPPPDDRSLTKLRQLLDERFDESELRTLCFELGVSYDDLPGPARADKARELIEYLERRKRIPDLIETGKRIRPDIDWDDTSR